MPAHPIKPLTQDELAAQVERVAELLSENVVASPGGFTFELDEDGTPTIACPEGMRLRFHLQSDKHPRISDCVLGDLPGDHRLSVHDLLCATLFTSIGGQSPEGLASRIGCELLPRYAHVYHRIAAEIAD